MPVGPYPNFAACKRGIKAQYRKKHPDWSAEKLDEVAGAVCGKMEQQHEDAPCPLRYKNVLLERGIPKSEAEAMAEELFWYMVEKIYGHA